MFHVKRYRPTKIRKSRQDARAAVDRTMTAHSAGGYRERLRRFRLLIPYP
jgi:hypothetical protein